MPPDTQTAWQNAGVDYTFAPNGQMDPLIANVTLNNVTVERRSARQRADSCTAPAASRNSPIRTATRRSTCCSRTASPPASCRQVSVNDKGRVVGTYSNGRTLDLAEITLANFNGANNLKRIDGGAFEVTDESGPAIYGASGKIVGSSLEGSNTDIADEFTKLIVTQQAYSANTRVISTTNQMVQDLLNMLR